MTIIMERSAMTRMPIWQLPSSRSLPEPHLVLSATIRETVGIKTGQGSLSNLPSGCSIPVAMSEPKSSAPGIKKPVRRRRTEHAGRRRTRSKSPGNDPDDADYVDGNDGLTDIDIQLRPSKRQRRTVAPRIAPGPVRHEALGNSPAAAVGSEEAGKPCFAPSTVDLTTDTDSDDVVITREQTLDFDKKTGNLCILRSARCASAEAGPK
ncbi:hypothetical protein M432DRAFT_430961 [Thermoascus aurantiacus ATCC 26904]